MSSPPDEDLRVPAPTEPKLEWWSDAIALMLRRLGYGKLALNPGASFRGLHDSLVNELGDADPEMVLCLHEEHAVAVAHGYAKVTGEPMAVALHTNVGLMHATMAIFNAFCDRVPMVIVGATGPFAADRRRPWIEWIHTSADQGALIRPFIKWDDSPASGPAALESLARADAVTRAKPAAPTYVCFGTGVLESESTFAVTFPEFEEQRPARAARARGDRGGPRRGALRRRRAATPPGRPGGRGRGWLAGPGRAGRAPRRPRPHRPEGGGRLPPRSSRGRRRPRHVPHPLGARADRRRRRDPGARLGRPRGDPAPGPRRGAAGGEDRLRDPGRRPAQRLEQGPLRPAAGRPADRRRPRPAGRGAARRAR